MDPNTTEKNQQSFQPETIPPQTTTVPPQLNQSPPPTEPPAYGIPVSNTNPKSNTGLIVSLIVGGLLLVLAVLAVVFLPSFVKSLQTKSFANKFMSSMVKGDIDSAVEASGGESSRAFLTSASKDLKDNSYSSGDYKFDGEGSSHYLFKLSGGEQKWARVTVDNEKDKRVITGFVYGKSELKLIPPASDDSRVPETSGRPDTTSPKTTESTSGGCLDANSFTALTSFPQEPYPNGKYLWTDNVFFKADATEYDMQEVTLERYQKFKDFYKQNSSKQFTITLSGTVNSDSPAIELSNARAEKVKADLISIAGMPASIIRIGEPQNVVNQLTIEASRNVDIKIESPDSCSNAGR